MHRLRQFDGRRSSLAAAAIALALAGVLVVLGGLRGSAGPPQPAAPATVSPAARASDPTPAPAPAPASALAASALPGADLGPVLPASVPVALDIASIDVHSTTLVPLSIDATGTLPAPTEFATPGWYTGGPNPGQLGPAVIAGHVDGPDGPAVFYRLGQLAAGAQVDITRQDGTVARFTIDLVASYSKADFPTALVYGRTSRAEIRLITCGGAFDPTTGHYVDNIIAFGHLNA